MGGILRAARAWRFALATALIAAVSVALRVPFRSVPLITDEGGYAYVAHWMERGLTLYRDLWFDRPQAIFLLYRAQLAMLGETVEAIRDGAALYNAATTVLVCMLGARLRSRRAGLAAGGLFAVASVSPIVEGFTANAELYMALPVAAAVLLAHRKSWFWAGVAGALACAVKPTAAFTVAPGLAVLLMAGGRRSRGALMCAAGAGCGALPFVAHGASIDPALYWYSVVGFRLAAHSALSVGGSWWGELARTAPAAVVALGPLWLLAGAGAVATWRTQSGRVGTAMLLGSLVGAAAGGYWYWHYFVGTVLPAALLGGLALDRSGIAWRDTPGVALALATVGALALNARAIGASPEETSLRLYHRPAYVASREIAAYVRDRTTERDTIFAAFAQADLYHLASRRAAVRQLYWTEINRIPGALDALLDTLDDAVRRPKYVIEIDADLEVPGRAAQFWERIASHYESVGSIGGFTIYRAVEEAGE